MAWDLYDEPVKKKNKSSFPILKMILFVILAGAVIAGIYLLLPYLQQNNQQIARVIPTPAPTSNLVIQPTAIQSSTRVPVINTPVTSANLSIPDAVLLNVNNLRAEQGLQPLRLNEQLNEAAQYHSNYMAQMDILSHEGAGQSTFDERIFATGYPGTALGENILYRFDTDPIEAFKQWRDSPPHYANMMNEIYDEMGLAYTRGNNGRVYFTMTLGRGGGISQVHVLPTLAPVQSTAIAIVPTVVQQEPNRQQIIQSPNNQGLSESDTTFLSDVVRRTNNISNVQFDYEIDLQAQTPSQMVNFQIEGNGGINLLNNGEMQVQIHAVILMQEAGQIVQTPEIIFILDRYDLYVGVPSENIWLLVQLGDFINEFMEGIFISPDSESLPDMLNDVEGLLMFGNIVHYISEYRLPNVGNVAGYETLVDIKGFLKSPEFKTAIGEMIVVGGNLASPGEMMNPDLIMTMINDSSFGTIVDMLLPHLNLSFVRQADLDTRYFTHYGMSIDAGLTGQGMMLLTQSPSEDTDISMQAGFDLFNHNIPFQITLPPRELVIVLTVEDLLSGSLQLQ